MQPIGEIIRQRRKRLGLTLTALAEAVGATKGYLSMVENARVANPPSDRVLRSIEKALDIADGELVRAADWQRTPQAVRSTIEHASEDARRGAELVRWLKDVTRSRAPATATGSRNLDALFQSGELARRIHAALDIGDETTNARRPAKPQSADDSIATIATPVRYRVPLINRVAAGYPTDFTDLDYPARVADEFVTCPDVTDPTAFAARVVGESMCPDYRAGDIVVFSPEAAVTDGCDCFVRLEPDHETTFKRIFFLGEAGERIRLQPLNPKFPTREYDREQIAGMYRAVCRIQPL